MIDHMGQVSALRARFPFLQSAPFHALQQGAVDVDGALQRFFAGQPRHPTWRTTVAAQRALSTPTSLAGAWQRSLAWPMVGARLQRLASPTRSMAVVVAGAW